MVFYIYIYMYIKNNRLLVLINLTKAQVNAFRERRALALSLDDTRTAVKKLHRMVNIIVRIIILIVWLLILGITTRKFLVLITSQILLVVFMFGNSCRLVFEAIIFLFVMHPFDVGDRCEIDGVQVSTQGSLHSLLAAFSLYSMEMQLELQTPPHPQIIFFFFYDALFLICFFFCF